MLSRVADSLYWMSRYLERAEHIARVVDVNLNLTLDRAPADAARHWGRLLASLPEPPPWARTAAVDPLERCDCRPGQPRVDRRVRRRRARERAPGARADQLRDVGGAQPPVPRRCRHRADTTPTGAAGRTSSCTATDGGVHLFQGVTDATMTHGEGWHFMELGRFLERASATAALLEVQYREFEWSADQAAGVSEYVEWVGLLKSCCAFEAYCRHYTADVAAAAHRRVPGAGRRLPALDPLRRRPHPGSLQRAGGADQAAATAAPSGWPAGCCASLDYGQMDEIIGDLPAYLQDIVAPGQQINGAMHQQYIAYPVDSGLTA